MSESTPSRPSAPQLTSARISLGAAGCAIPIAEQLRFQLDHALARDAVHAPLDMRMLIKGLAERGLTPVVLKSAAQDRRIYLRRPDLGRRLHLDSVPTLHAAQVPETEPPPRIVILFADGLSALALERHALPLLEATLPLLPQACALVPILTNARVALGDAVGAHLCADLTVMLIGERPGLSSPDSLGCYITWKPQPGKTTDADRNCISNIRAEGLGYAEAAHRIAHYVREAARIQMTGTALKDPGLNQLR